MHKRKFKDPRILVWVSGIALIIGGVLLNFKETRSIAGYGLVFFVFLAAVMIHRFWEETDK